MGKDKGRGGKNFYGIAYEGPRKKPKFLGSVQLKSINHRFKISCDKETFMKEISKHWEKGEGKKARLSLKQSINFS